MNWLPKKQTRKPRDPAYDPIRPPKPEANEPLKWCPAHNEDTEEESGAWVLATSFNKDKGKKDGLAGVCRDCDARRKKKWRADNHAYDMAKKKQWAADNPESRSASVRKWDDANGAQYREEHREELRAKNDTYYYRDVEASRARVRDYYDTHKEERAAYSKQYAKDNPDIINERNMRRICRLKNVPGSHTAAEWQALKAYYDYRCAYCGRHESGCGRLHRDHVIPLARPDLNPTNDIDNILPACRTCNSRKNNKPLTDELRKHLAAKALEGAQNAA